MIPTEFLSKQTQLHNRSRAKTREQYEELLPLFEPSQGIPKHLFQICLRGKGSTSEKVLSELPPSFQENIQNLKDRNADFTYHLFSDQEAEEFIRTQYGDPIYQYYKRIDSHYPAARADLLRYLLLYAQGGVYMDLKSFAETPLSEKIGRQDQFLLFYWDNKDNGQHHFLIPDYIKKGEMLQAFIISARGHIFLRSVILAVMKAIDNYDPYTSGVGWAGVLSTTGPALYTKTIYDFIQSDSTASSHYREDLPFRSFGFRISFSGNYTPGAYQKALSLRDYRKCGRPVITSSSSILQTLNLLWCSVLRFYRARILHAN